MKKVKSILIPTLLATLVMSVTGAFVAIGGVQAKAESTNKGNMSITLTDGIAVNYYAELDGSVQSATATFESEVAALDATVTGEKVGDLWKFTYTNVTPQYIDQAFTIKVNDEVFAENYSVAQYCTELQSKTAKELKITQNEYDKSVVVAKDLIYYGQAAKSYKLGGEVTATQGTAYEGNVDSKTLSATPASGNTIKSATVVFDYVPAVKFGFELPQAEGVTVFVNDKQVELTGSGTAYTAKVENIYATDFDKAIKVELKENGTTVQALTYAINDYTARTQTNASASAEMKLLARALYSYGKGAETLKNIPVYTGNGDGTHAVNSGVENCDGNGADTCYYCDETVAHEWGEAVSNGDGTHTSTCAAHATGKSHQKTENCATVSAITAHQKGGVSYAAGTTANASDFVVTGYCECGQMIGGVDGAIVSQEALTLGAKSVTLTANGLTAEAPVRVAQTYLAGGFNFIVDGAPSTAGVSNNASLRPFISSNAKPTQERSLSITVNMAEAGYADVIVNMTNENFRAYGSHHTADFIFEDCYALVVNGVKYPLGDDVVVKGTTTTGSTIDTIYAAFDLRLANVPLNKGDNTIKIMVDFADDWTPNVSNEWCPESFHSITLISTGAYTPTFYQAESASYVNKGGDGAIENLTIYGLTTDGVWTALPEKNNTAYLQLRPFLTQKAAYDRGVEKSMTFTVNANQAGKANLSVRMSNGNYNDVTKTTTAYSFNQSYKLFVNGKEVKLADNVLVHGCSNFGGENEFIRSLYTLFEVNLGEIDLNGGANTVTIQFYQAEGVEIGYGTEIGCEVFDYIRVETLG